MKKRFYKIAKLLGAEIITYKTYRSNGMGGLQVYEIEAKINSNVLLFSDSYFHLSNDATKLLKSFEQELKEKAL